MMVLFAAMAAAPAPKSGFDALPLLEQSTIAPARLWSNGSGSATALYIPAPVPDNDRVAPLLAARGPGQPELKPSLFVTPKGYRGEGFVSGSSVQGTQEIKVRPAAGFSLKLPLQ